MTKCNAEISYSIFQEQQFPCNGEKQYRGFQNEMNQLKRLHNTEAGSMPVLLYNSLADFVIEVHPIQLPLFDCYVKKIEAGLKKVSDILNTDLI